MARECLYDTKPITDGGVASLTFFVNPTAGYLWSNMPGQGALPKPQEFYALGIAIEIFPDTAADMDDGVTDTWAGHKKKIFEAAYVQFTVGQKYYCHIPLKRIPEGLGSAGIGVGGEDTNTLIITNGVPDVNHYWPLAVKLGELKPVHIMSQQSFRVDVYWPTAAQSAPGLGTGVSAQCRCYLAGIRLREVQ